MPPPTSLPGNRQDRRKAATRAKILAAFDARVDVFVGAILERPVDVPVAASIGAALTQ